MVRRTLCALVASGISVAVTARGDGVAGGGNMLPLPTVLHRLAAILLACLVSVSPTQASEDFGASAPELQSARDLEARGDFEAAIQAYASLCRAGNMVACHLGGLVATRQVGDFDKAWKAAHCAMAFTPDMRPCIAMHDLRPALDKRAADGGAMLKLACEGGLAWACTDGADLLRQRSELGGADQQRLYYAAGCRGGDVRGCTAVAPMLVEGIGGPKDEKTALNIYRQICEQLGNSGPCHVYGDMVERGVGTAIDPAAARAIFRKNCEAPNHDGESCLRLARQFRDGKGGPPDHSEARKYFGKACHSARKVIAGCDELVALQSSIR